MGGVGHEVAPGGGGPPLLGDVAPEQQHLTPQQRRQLHRERAVRQLHLQPARRPLQGPPHRLGQLAPAGHLERGHPRRPSPGRQRVEGGVADAHLAVLGDDGGGVGQAGQQLLLGRVAHGGEAAQLPLHQQRRQLGHLAPQVGPRAARQLGPQGLERRRQLGPARRHRYASPRSAGSTIR
jgi:hypothetical protein